MDWQIHMIPFCLPFEINSEWLIQNSIWDKFQGSFLRDEITFLRVTLTCYVRNNSLFYSAHCLALSHLIFLGKYFLQVKCSITVNFRLNNTPLLQTLQTPALRTYVKSPAELLSLLMHVVVSLNSCSRAVSPNSCTVTTVYSVYVVFFLITMTSFFFSRHEFHKMCIDPWLVEHRTCPMCKLNILKELGVVSSVLSYSAGFSKMKLDMYWKKVLIYKLHISHERKLLFGNVFGF